MFFSWENNSNRRSEGLKPLLPPNRQLICTNSSSKSGCEIKYLAQWLLSWLLKYLTASASALISYCDLEDEFVKIICPLGGNSEQKSSTSYLGAICLCGSSSLIMVCGILVVGSSTCLWSIWLILLLSFEKQLHFTVDPNSDTFDLICTWTKETTTQCQVLAVTRAKTSLWRISRWTKVITFSKKPASA